MATKKEKEREQKLNTKRWEYLYWNYLTEGQRYFGHDSQCAWIDTEWKRIEAMEIKPDWWNSCA